jgi:hypothetical protein
MRNFHAEWEVLADEMTVYFGVASGYFISMMIGRSGTLSKSVRIKELNPSVFNRDFEEYLKSFPMDEELLR